MFHMKMLRRKQKKQTKGDGDISPVSAIDIERMWNICSSFARPPILFISISLSIAPCLSHYSSSPLAISLFGCFLSFSSFFDFFSFLLVCALRACLFARQFFGRNSKSRGMRFSRGYRFFASLARTSKYSAPLIRTRSRYLE